MIGDQGGQNGKRKPYFAVCTIHYRSFLGNLLEWYQDKIEDIPQDIRVSLPLGFVGTGSFASELWRYWKQCQKQDWHLGSAACCPRKDIADGHVYWPGFLISGEIGEVRLVSQSDNGHHCGPGRQSFLPRNGIGCQHWKHDSTNLSGPISDLHILPPVRCMHL